MSTPDMPALVVDYTDRHSDADGAGWSSGRETDAVGFAVIAVLGATLSMVATGYVFGTGSNFYSLPVIGRLYDEPQFQSDVYMQSLRYYAAGPFLLLRGADRFIDPRSLFAALLFTSRLVLFVGFLACLRLLGVRRRGDRALAVILLAFTNILKGYSAAGSHGMFVEVFSHSEVADGWSLIALYFAARGRLATAFAFNGVTFFTNGFVAVWNAIPLAFITTLLLLRGRIRPIQVVVRGAIGLVLFAILASPVIVNVLSNPEYGQPTPFDYQVFLKFYYPFHFLFQYTSFADAIKLVTLAITGVLAFIALGRRGPAAAEGAEPFLAALLGFVAVMGWGFSRRW